MLPGGAGVKPRGSSSQAERVADNRDFIQAVSTSIQGLAQLVSNFEANIRAQQSLSAQKLDRVEGSLGVVESAVKTAE